MKTSDISWTLLLGLAVAVLFNAAAPDIQAGAAQAPADRCSNFKNTFSFPNASITSAQTVPAGTFNPANAPQPGLETPATPITGLPTFCRVIGILRPVRDSEIGIEVWLPVSDWNGKLQSIANHGSGGKHYYGDMGSELKKNYAVASTDAGHIEAEGDNWALGHPERVIDYAWRAVHEMTVASKAIIAAYYGAAPRFSYYNGCSTGGRQTLKEAQMFPDDYDGIISGSGFHNWTGVNFAGLWKTQVMLKDGVEGPSYLPPSKFQLVVDAAMTHCKALKAAPTDTFLGNPTRCDWKPQTLVCKAGQDPNTCITAAQAEALEKIYSPLRNPRTNAEIYPGATRITEPSWAESAARGLRANDSATRPTRSLQSIVFNKPDWSWRTVNFDSDVAAANESDAKGPKINAVDPDLSRFKKSGGKLIEYQGWLDSNLAPYAAQDYNRVVATIGGGSRDAALKETQDFYRLFLVPAMGHCRGGPGPNSFGAETHLGGPNDPQHDIVGALEEWVERGIAPAQIIATKFVKDNPKLGIVMQRPLCPHPQEARYKGAGSTADAANFTCVSPKM